MTADGDPLIEALRAEMQEYGGLLNLFEEQQQAVLRREPDRVLALHDKISAQFATIREHRLRREALVNGCAHSAGRPAGTPLRELLGLFAEPIRPLFEALIDEVNRLLSRTKRRAQQNRMLLARSIEVMQQVLAQLDPDATTKTYSPSGRMKFGLPSARPRLLVHS